MVYNIIISIILTKTIKSDEEESNINYNSVIIKVKYQINKENEEVILFNSHFLINISSIKINGTESPLSNYQYFENIGVFEI